MPKYDDMPHDNYEPPIGFHKFINDSYEADMLESAFKAVSSVKDGWGFMRSYEPPEGEGFMFNRNPPAKLQEIEAAILKADSGHSGASFGFTMRVMQRIAKYGFERYYDERCEPVEPKETPNEIIARLEKENASLRAQVAMLTAPKKELTREEKIRAALAKGCTGGYPCAGCLARKNMLVEEWQAEQADKRAKEEAFMNSPTWRENVPVVSETNVPPKKSNFPYPCACHRAKGLDGWCGVAGGGVPACDH